MTTKGLCILYRGDLMNFSTKGQHFQAVSHWHCLVSLLNATCRACKLNCIHFPFKSSQALTQHYICNFIWAPESDGCTVSGWNTCVGRNLPLMTASVLSVNPNTDYGKSRCVDTHKSASFSEAFPPSSHTLWLLCDVELCAGLSSCVLPSWVSSMNCVGQKRNLEHSKNVLTIVFWLFRYVHCNNSA